MKRSTLVCIIVASSLILAGLLIFSAALGMLKWDFSKLSTKALETNEHTVVEDFDDIFIDTDTADIRFVMSENETASVICKEFENERHSVEVKDGTLRIELNTTKKWYEYIGITIASPSVTVCLPEAEYTSLSINASTGDVEIPKQISFGNIGISVSTGDINCLASAREGIKIKTTTGHIALCGVTAGELDLKVSTGKVDLTDIECSGNIKILVSTGKSHLENVNCKSLTSEGDTGDISLENVIATDTFSIERDTGDVTFIKCDAEEIYVETDTGDVTASFLTDKVVIYETDTGHVNVPRSTTGTRCEITTDTGDIKVTIEP